MYEKNIGLLKSTLKIHVQISKSNFHNFLQELIETATLLLFQNPIDSKLINFQNPPQIPLEKKAKKKIIFSKQFSKVSPRRETQDKVFLPGGKVNRDDGPPAASTMTRSHFRHATFASHLITTLHRPSLLMSREKVLID